ncbi:uncharacterized protein PRCAT00001027001 [Priceomyces carsonii]|uniref:uncharacterized protein n=1 Tax=Priceomyces carsonii TaxID=28549 RepID=UPI002ED9A46B|nr:unnamed protein product [Priceomyces carsonii]
MSVAKQPLPGHANNGKPLSKRSAKDYLFGTRIGEGSYSTVFAAVDLHSNQTYAIKVLSKRHIVKEDKIKYVNIEKTTLHRLGQQHPGIVQLYYTFQDEASLFFVLDFAEYGELLSIIRKFGSLSDQVAKFYMCQIIDAIKFIHLKGVIHRDLKPENILVGYDLNLKITDFGAAKLLGDDNNDVEEGIDYENVEQPIASGKSPVHRRGSFVGTAEYVPPELLKNNICGFESDVWALGCILYQFFNGTPPFKGSTEYLTFEKIINVDYSYKPSHPVPPEAKTIIDSVLVAEPSNRLTIPEIMSSKWFHGVPWNDRNYIWNRRVPKLEPQSSSNSSISMGTPYALAFKNGSNRNMNKSNSYQQLHSQIQSSEFNLVPSLAKKAYQPATKIKKGFAPPQPPISATHSPHQSYQNNFSPVPTVSQTGTIFNPHFTMQQPQVQQPQVQQPQVQQPQVPQPQVQQPQVQQPQLQKPPLQKPPLQKPQMQSSDHSIKIVPKKSPNLEKKSGNPDLPFRSERGLNKSSTNFMKQSSSAQVNTPPTSSESQHSIFHSSRGPSASATEIQAANAAASAASTKMQRKHTELSSKSARRSEVTNASQGNKTKSSSIKSYNKRKVANDIKFSEISTLLSSNEKILKMDMLLKLYLGKDEAHRRPGSHLDEESINTLISKYSHTLQKKSELVITVVTNKARVFFISSDLNVMLIDLKANQGNDYLMYDYEFESIAVDDNASITDGEDIYGYLVLELVKEGGDLIFLKRVSEMDKLTLTDPIRVINNKKEKVTLGDSYGWIDCLLMAKQMVAKENKESKSKSKVKQPKGKVSTKKVRRLTTESISDSSSANNKASDFAYAAAAAAHK